jgi:hypothetical protein
MQDFEGYIFKHLGATIDCPCTMSDRNVGEEVIVYGISKNIIPTGKDTGILFLENDPKYIGGDVKDAVHVEIDENNSLSVIIKDGVTNFLYNRPTFIRGRLKDKRVIVADGKVTTEYLVKPTYDLRVLL